MASADTLARPTDLRNSERLYVVLNWPVWRVNLSSKATTSPGAGAIFPDPVIYEVVTALHFCT